MKSKSKQKAEINEKKKQLIELTSRFCDKKLDEEYKELCIKLIEKMSKKDRFHFYQAK